MGRSRVRGERGDESQLSFFSVPSETQLDLDRDVGGGNCSEISELWVTVLDKKHKPWFELTALLCPSAHTYCGIAGSHCIKTPSM